MFRKSLVFSLLALILAPSFAVAQGLLIDDRDDHRWRLPRPIIMPQPRPLPQNQGTYKIKELAVNVNLADQIAKVQVSQAFVNTSSRQMEVSFIFPLPYDGAVDSLTFMVDGTEYEAKLLSASEARGIYESYMRRNEDPALLEWLGHGMFKTSVFPVPAGAERKVTMRYSQVCRKANGLTEFLFPLSTAKYTDKPVEKVEISVAIQSQAKIKNVYSPTHSIDVKRPSNLQANASFTLSNEIPTSDFRLLYDVGEAAVGASVLSYRPDTGDEGYFLMLVSPEIQKSSEEVQKKTMVFVVDRSGSMSGKKWEQAKEALKFVLNNLNEGDTFNIIAYDSKVESFKPELQRYDDQTRQLALGWVEGLYPGGSTNIDGALKSALAQLQDDSRPSYVLFLTDGLPTAGETKEQQIVLNVQDRNKVRARVFSFGVGYDLNSRLLDKLSQAAFGRTEFVRPNESIETAVSQLYSRIGAPAMTDVQLAVEIDGRKVEQGPPVNRVYPRDAYDLFAGDQLVVVGRYSQPGAAKVTVRGKVDGAEKELDFPAQLTETSGDETYAFVEKLWAMRRVGEIIDDIDLNGKNQELVNELVALSTKHGILTPYTSFLADDQPTLEPGGRPVPLAFGRPERAAQAAREADRALNALNDAEAGAGRGGVEQRALKGDLKFAAQAPASGQARFRRLGAEKDEAVDTIQHVGSKTFYRRGEQWVDSTLTPEQEEKLQKIERFSKEYFDLAAKLGKDALKYLAMEGQVVVVLDGQAYAF